MPTTPAATPGSKPRTTGHRGEGAASSDRAAWADSSTPFGSETESRCSSNCRMISSSSSAASVCADAPCVTSADDSWPMTIPVPWTLPTVIGEPCCLSRLSVISLLARLIHLNGRVVSNVDTGAATYVPDLDTVVEDELYLFLVQAKIHITITEKYLHCPGQSLLSKKDIHILITCQKVVASLLSAGKFANALLGAVVKDMTIQNRAGLPVLLPQCLMWLPPGPIHIVWGQEQGRERLTDAKPQCGS